MKPRRGPVDPSIATTIEWFRGRLSRAHDRDERAILREALAQLLRDADASREPLPEPKPKP